MDFKEIIDAFAADAGMTESVAYEEENVCHLMIDGMDYGFRDGRRRVARDARARRTRTGGHAAGSSPPEQPTDGFLKV